MNKQKWPGEKTLKMKSNKYELSPITKKKHETVVPLMNKDRQMEHNIQSQVKHQ